MDSVALKSRRIFLIFTGIGEGDPRNNCTQIFQHGCYHYCGMAGFDENDKMAVTFPACYVTKFPAVDF